jgi:hypothetical protein
LNTQFKDIAPYLNTGSNKLSRIFSYVGLGIGILLLLCCLQMLINVNQLLQGRNPRKTGYDYISITKKITNDNIAESHSFSEQEIATLKRQPFIEDATPLLGNQFIVSATGGSALPFTTDIFLESIDEDFIDTLPPGFTWQPGQAMVPIIISSDYVELYNTVFAPSRGLPQVSQSSISSILVQLECSGINGTQIFKGNIVALSDRINSMIVPKTFMQWANKNIANMTDENPSRIYLKTTDANNTDFLAYLQAQGYQVNKDKTKFGRVKQVLQAVISGLGGFAVLVILLAMLLFSFYLQLMIARSKDNLQLLLLLGYSPNWLSKTVSKRWVPVYGIIVLVALMLAGVMQFFFQQIVFDDAELISPLLHWTVIVLAIALFFLSIILNKRFVKNALGKLQ